jgi:hypothetical protein
MGPPIDHGALLIPPRALGPQGGREKRASSSCFERFMTNRFEELNNYSDLMTSRFVAVQVDLQSALSIPPRMGLSQTSQPAAFKWIPSMAPFRHRRQRNECKSGFFGEHGQNRDDDREFHVDIR